MRGRFIFLVFQLFIFYFLLCDSVVLCCLEWNLAMIAQEDASNYKPVRGNLLPSEESLVAHYIQGAQRTLKSTHRGGAHGLEKLSTQANLPMHFDGSLEFLQWNTIVKLSEHLPALGGEMFPGNPVPWLRYNPSDCKAGSWSEGLGLWPPGFVASSGSAHLCPSQHVFQHQELFQTQSWISTCQNSIQFVILILTVTQLPLCIISLAFNTLSRAIIFHHSCFSELWYQSNIFVRLWGPDIYHCVRVTWNRWFLSQSYLLSHRQYMAIYLHGNLFI